MEQYGNCLTINLYIYRSEDKKKEGRHRYLMRSPGLLLPPFLPRIGEELFIADCERVQVKNVLHQPGGRTWTSPEEGYSCEISAWVVESSIDSDAAKFDPRNSNSCDIYSTLHRLGWTEEDEGDRPEDREKN